ncbi:hypothetical protein ACF05F_32305 [Rhodococcus erythropolis]
MHGQQEAGKATPPLMGDGTPADGNWGDRAPGHVPQHDLAGDRVVLRRPGPEMAEAETSQPFGGAP